MLADIVVVVIILLCILIGYFRGLIKVGIRLLGFVLSIIVALVLYNPVSNFIIDNTEVVPNLKNTISTVLYEKEEKSEENDKQSGNFLDMMSGYVNNYTESIKENTSDFIAGEIAVAIVRVVTWIGLFMLAKVFMLVLKLFGNIVERIPIIKQFNRTRRSCLWDFGGINYCVWRACYNSSDYSYDEK